MFEDGFHLHHDIDEDRGDRPPRLKRELFPDMAGERKTHFAADEEGEEGEAEQNDGDAAEGEADDDESSSDSDVSNHAEKASKVPFSPMPLHGNDSIAQQCSFLPAQWQSMHVCMYI